ncbi:phosphatidylinositol transporter KNAG_0F00520 [Huiozyma naganishii CBS 8797]|uniref:CRAL-TRIO domain-containing protein n=1 Tax=Huiozyma naganishii (strain ATCC MYA-139 / BCRC 22969 / CBS 8797 / KCTC 17520 / NBRC 10181 / NCYC 3082 / Yp74L-3) TaxID=1071383 RepID=J7S864_HUIN7|nr:hypothetical protein KNAG_0F00520 [Kazachstania naganishii CBS 8797]CCK70721.1 hypothetical protein KNAG_0F00520 [Kazachstania naganishii CBS 8797]
MGLFSRKKDAPAAKKRDDLIPCDRMVLDPPQQKGKHGYGHGLSRISPEQQQMYTRVRNHFADEALVLPQDTNASGNDSAELTPLSSWERFWVSRECILRYLRASNWHEEEAVKNLSETLVWRRETGLTHDPNASTAPGLSAESVAVENETGKELVLGFDRDSRPLFYMKNGRQNTEPSFRQVQHMIYMTEAAVTACPQGIDQITVLVDFKLYKEPGIISDKAPPIAIARACLNVLQNHYPERLAKCILINIPWYLWAFVKMMYPFLDPATREKAVFDEPFEKYIDPDQLDAQYNGKLDFHYKHDVYWPDMVAKCDASRERQYERFSQFGGAVGLSEFDFKGTHDELKYPIDYDMSK